MSERECVSERVCERKSVCEREIECVREREPRNAEQADIETLFFIDNLLVRIHLTIEIILADRPCAMRV